MIQVTRVLSFIYSSREEMEQDLSRRGVRGPLPLGPTGARELLIFFQEDKGPRLPWFDPVPPDPFKEEGK